MEYSSLLQKGCRWGLQFEFDWHEVMFMFWQLWKCAAVHKEIEIEICGLRKFYLILLFIPSVPMLSEYSFSFQHTLFLLFSFAFCMLIIHVYIYIQMKLIHVKVTIKNHILWKKRSPVYLKVIAKKIVLKLNHFPL